MKILAISADSKLKDLVKSFAAESEHYSFIYNQGTRPLDIVGFAYEKNPSVILLDDDYVKPNAAVMIATLKKMKKNLKIIFITSDSSVELGKEISPLGIAYYAIKPLDKNEFDEVLNSISKTKSKTTY